MIEIKGFHSGSQKDKDAETETEFERFLGSKFLDREREPYPSYVGRYATLHVAGGNYIHGVYRGTTIAGNAVLIPSVQREIYPVDLAFREVKTIFYWDDKNPELIRSEAIMGISPVREKYLDYLVKNAERELPKFTEDKPQQEQ